MIALRPAPASLPEGQRIYAIGDIHGCISHLDALHRLIAQDIQDRPCAEITLIHLGDYIDRGPGSAEVIGRLLSPSTALMGVTKVNIKGNHEAMMLEAFDQGDEDSFEGWFYCGGDASLASWQTSHERWRQEIPADHIAAIRDLKLVHTLGDYAFIHAGMLPGVPLAEQAEEDLIWIRDPFLNSPDTFSHVIVHGHTVEGYYPIIRKNRIGIDTGAVFGGCLSCLMLEGNVLGVMQC